ncbi:MAG TPA: hypothetical protein VFS43_44225 [Polyangiaceae bacterium]|nr:hypothetical protein [Polyangiaceae bacterium]
MNDEPLRYSEDDSRPEAVRDALRSMRAEGPSDDSRKAALAAFGFPPKPAGPPALPLFLRWAIVGLVLGLAALGLVRALGG